MENITGQIKCNWKHKENDFNDFAVQYLIPHKESTRGPKIAVGDVNKDGLDDFYACGAKGQPGVLMIQQKDGSSMQQIRHCLPKMHFVKMWMQFFLMPMAMDIRIYW